MSVSDVVFEKGWLMAVCRDARIRCMCDHDPAFFTNSPIKFEVPISAEDEQALFAYMNNRFKRWTGKSLKP